MNIRPQHTTHAEGGEKLRGHLAALLFAVVIAGSFSLGGKAAPFMDPAALNAVRFALATTAVTGLIHLARGQPPRMPVAFWRFAILGGLFGVYFITMFIALRIARPVSTSAVFTLIPLMSAGFGLLFLRQKTRPIVLFSLVIAATGSVWVIFRGNLADILNFQIGRGEAIFFVGCACHAAFVPLIRRFQREEHPLDFTMWILVATTAFLAAFGLPSLVNTQWAALPPIVWIAILYLAIFATATTTFLMRYAGVRLPASKVLAYGYLTPVFVILIEGATGYGWPTPSIFAGAVVIGMALLVMALAPDA